jgi:hypothetical protein
MRGAKLGPQANETVSYCSVTARTRRFVSLQRTNGIVLPTLQANLMRYGPWNEWELFASLRVWYGLEA